MTGAPLRRPRVLCPRCASHAYRNGRRSYVCQNYLCRHAFLDGAARRDPARGSGQIAGRRAEIEFRPLDARLVREIASIVNRSRESFDVLVHCQAGLNRSCLVAAEAMILAGRGPREAISQIRERHDPQALFNPAFVAWLMAKEVA